MLSGGRQKADPQRRESHMRDSSTYRRFQPTQISCISNTTSPVGSTTPLTASSQSGAACRPPRRGFACCMPGNKFRG